MKRFVIAGVATIAAAGALAAQASAQTTAPNTLDGEVLLAQFGKCDAPPGSPPPPNSPCAFHPDPPTVEATCDPDGVSTLRYEFDDEFTFGGGPYPGTFDESGTITIGPQEESPVPTSDDPAVPPSFDAVLTGSQRLSAGPLLTWTAEFEITSGTTTIQGTKTLTAEAPGFGVCQTFEGQGTPFPGQENLRGYFGIADARLSYTATIRTDDGVYRDEGTAVSDVRESFTTYTNRRADGTTTTEVGTDVGLMVEIFQSDLDAPQPVGKEFCKDGGWRDFPGYEFRNQGDCVSFFSTEGKNEPGQNVP
jgi:hypothetical protein